MDLSKRNHGARISQYGRPRFHYIQATLSVSRCMRGPYQYRFPEYNTCRTIFIRTHDEYYGWSRVWISLHILTAFGFFKARAKGIVFYVSALFFLGILFGYYVVAPLSVQFFGAFQITPEIKTDVTIASYMSTILSTVFYTGLFFLFPIVTFLLVKIGLFTPAFLIKYRKHAIVLILVLAAVITPPDVISQIIVTIPIYLLFEISILVAKRVDQSENQS
jgi:hypothetical protein